MSEIGYHIMLRLEDDRVIAPTEGARRQLARIVLERGRAYRLLGLGSADTHGHLLAACGRRAAGELVRRVKIGLTRRLAPGIDFAPTRFKPISDQHHLERALLYVLRQQEHHGLSADPYHDGSNLLDLLGLRVLGAYTRENVRALVPRVRREDLLGCLGIAGLERPVEAPLELLAPAAAAAAGLAELVGSSADVNAARRAAIEVAGERRMARDLATALGCSERTIKRLRSRPAKEALVTAVTLQVRLRVLKPAFDQGIRSV